VLNSILNDYCNQDASLEVRGTTKNVYGEYTYASPTTIKVRRQEAVQEIKTAYDEKKISKAVYYTTSLVKDLDKLDGNEVLFVGKWTGLSGEEIGYKVLV